MLYHGKQVPVLWIHYRAQWSPVLPFILSFGSSFRNIPLHSSAFKIHCSDVLPTAYCSLKLHTYLRIPTAISKAFINSGTNTHCTIFTNLLSPGIWSLVEYTNGPRFLARWIWETEDGKDRSLRNVGLFADYTVVYSARQRRQISQGSVAPIRRAVHFRYSRIYGGSTRFVSGLVQMIILQRMVLPSCSSQPHPTEYFTTHRQYPTFIYGVVHSFIHP
jgi:hypothetical protein